MNKNCESGDCAPKVPARVFIEIERLQNLKDENRELTEQLRNRLSSIMAKDNTIKKDDGQDKAKEFDDRSQVVTNLHDIGDGIIATSELLHYILEHLEV